MELIRVNFDGKIYNITDAIEPLLLLEQEYGKLSNVPDTFAAELKYFYFLMKGCNDNFDYTFERFIKLLPYQKGLQEDLKAFINKKKVQTVTKQTTLRRTGCGFLILLTALFVLVLTLIF